MRTVRDLPDNGEPARSEPGLDTTDTRIEEAGADQEIASPGQNGGSNEVVQQGGHERTETRGEGRGTIATGNSVFDVAFAGDLWSDEDKPSPSYETVLESSQRTEGPQERIPVVHQPDQTNGRAELVQGSGSKRPSSDAPGASSSTYANNKRTRVRKRVEQMRKETDQLDDKHSHVGGETLSMLVFLREETERRTGAENCRRREDREERLAHERLEREEREQVRREEAAAAQQLREDLTRRKAAAAVEKNMAVAFQLPWPAILATVCQMMW
ncbi:hypothetical protein JG688_00017521 [Phytophthora aleatoria]|uniref:Uncharacterized protein n=1 Tax=Phytophthora aleatoria TaxID=2496075 RepID=A0A8J5IDP4_9STRA|nr:hypothetical protein JG688_00017521 [Phytophthora aleatoria]